MDQKYLYKIVLAAVIFNDKNQVLLGKRSENEDVLPGHWGIPGGKIEARGNIENILEIELQREIMEEVGVKVQEIHYLESHLNESGKINICFTARIKSGKPKPLDETEKLEWCALSDVKKLMLTPHTLERIELAYKQLLQ